MAKNWNTTPEGRAYKQAHNKNNYDEIKFFVSKGIKKVFVDELKKEGETLSGFMNRFITFYLNKAGYTNEQLEEIIANAKKEKEKGL